MFLLIIEIKNANNSMRFDVCLKKLKKYVTNVFLVEEENTKKFSVKLNYKHDDLIPIKISFLRYFPNL